VAEATGSQTTAECHAQALLFASRSCRRRLHTIVEERECALHASQQRLSGRIEHDTTPAALEHCKAQLLLQHADLLAHRAVGQVQDLNRRAQLLEFGHRAKRGERV
jgi:hypothetical protein